MFPCIFSNAHRLGGKSGEMIAHMAGRDRPLGVAVCSPCSTTLRLLIRNRETLVACRACPSSPCQRLSFKYMRSLEELHRAIRKEERKSRYNTSRSKGTFLPSTIAIQHYLAQI
ncbi:hypothetical protein ASPBRDRAFT_459664 [Aspergillus brasiliensis CBS 101740]|uniref:Uncharacterized protein n=1 Tax=Aspergillus brasiliensis (strain CBS 101740 / IMI 381727 / IBT 21946) TaxID=767769 RepID=A0A1L9USG7_ASPBC|nr:hypothetical protein ASPBRDRAFT_459664 [Aspergillus brasiliensis CBS 101740]